MSNWNPHLFLLVGSLAITSSGIIFAQSQPNPNPGDPGEETPATHRSIPLRLGAVDAVQGELSLRVSLGPKLPGRVALGFTWAFDSQNPTQASYTYGGGEFRPVVWPSQSTKRLNWTVLVNGEPWSFVKNYTVVHDDNFDGAAIASARNVEDGRIDAVAKATSLSLAVGPFQWEAYPSPDGHRFFVRTWWKLVNPNNPTDAFSSAKGGQRMFIVDGENTIWTDGKGVSHFTTTWGDDVSVTESGLTHALPYPNLVTGGTITIKNEHHTGQSLKLEVKGSELKVTNTLGLPEASLQGRWNYAQRVPREVLSEAEILYDVTFFPWQLTVTGGNSTLTTELGWTSGIGAQISPPLKSITHPNGLVEAFEYGATPFKKTGDYAYDPETGTWMGFRPSSNQVYNATQYLPITKVTQSKGGKGTTVVMSRVTPDWVESANPAGATWNERNHTTTLQTYPNPNATGPCRTVKLTHPSFPSPTWTDGIWGNPSRASDAEMRAAYLFATGAVQKAELMDEAGTTYKTVTFGNWDLRSFVVPSGAIAQNGQALAIPITAAPAATVVQTPGLPDQVKVKQDWDQFTFMTAHGGTEAPGTTSTAGLSATWGSGPLTPAKSVDTASTTTWIFASNQTWLPTQVTRTLTGTKLPSLRSGAGTTVALEQTTYGYDTMGRPTVVTTKLGTGFTQESKTYEFKNPQPKSVTQWAGFGTDLANAEGVNFAGLAGKTFTYSDGPDYLLLSETDKLTGLTTTYERDTLGRVTKTTDPSGAATTTTYDSWGRVHEVTRLATGGIGGVTRRYTYEPTGAWTKTEVIAEGKTLTSITTLDAFGRVVNEVAADGGTRTTSYNGYGEKIAQSPWLRPGQTPYGNFTFHYDGKGRLTETKDPQGRTLSKAPSDPAWDALLSGVVTTTLDDRNLSRKSLTDLLGQQKSLVDPLGQTTTFTYDPYGRMSRMSLAGQNRTYAYDDLGHLVSRVEPEEGQTTYSDFTVWGAPGKSWQKGISGTGQVQILTVFDTMGRPVQIYDDFGQTFLRNIGYDPQHPDRVTAVEEFQADGSIHETYGYDALGRQVAKSITDDYRQEFTLSRRLDAMGNTTTLTYPGMEGRKGATLAIGYDDAFRPNALTKDGRGRANMTYDQVTGTAVSSTLAFGNSTTTKRTFDRGELTRIEHAAGLTVENHDMTWTAGGLLLNRGNDTFNYDELGRLNYAQTHGLSGEVHTQSFRYDAFGNRTQNQVTNTGNGIAPTESLNWTAVYGTNNQLPATVKAPGGGDLLTGARYDDYGRLEQVSAIPGQPSTQAEWIYDSSGRMTMENGVRFLLDAQGLRFRRTKPDESIQYTIYGFNRDPLSTFETSIAAPASAKVGSTEAKISRSKRLETVYVHARGVYGKMKIPPPRVLAPQRHAGSGMPSEAKPKKMEVPRLLRVPKAHAQTIR